MGQIRTLSQTLIAVSILVACSTVQKANPSLDDARAEYNAAQANPQVTSLAPTELQQAHEALNAANTAWEHRDGNEKVDQLAHIAKEKVTIAEQTAKQKAAENTIANAANEREQLRLDERTAEADKAKERQREAEQGQREAELRASQLAEQLRELSAKQTDRGMVVTLSDLLFDTNKAELTSGGMQTVQKVANILMQHPDRNVLVEGFTDSTGTDSYNLDLSMRRANAVRLALIQMGVAVERIQAHGNGKEFPVASNDTAAGRQLNRRVEIVFPGDVSKEVSQK